MGHEGPPSGQGRSSPGASGSSGDGGVAQGGADNPVEGDQTHSVVYPKDLKQAEDSAVSARRRRHGIPDRGIVGLALSGGGIRSATFALGFLQALARARLLAQVDMLSTVSGGGYIGAFLGRLYMRKMVAQAVLAGEPATGRRHDPLRYLRDNGNYLAPNGSDDMFVAVAILLRNWLGVLVTMGFVPLTAFISFRLVEGLLTAHTPVPRSVIELTPAVWLAAWAGAAALVLGWAYWLVPPSGVSRWGAGLSVAGSVVACVLGVGAGLALMWVGCSAIGPLIVALSAGALVLALVGLACNVSSRWTLDHGGARQSLTAALGAMLPIGSAAAFVGLADLVGRKLSMLHSIADWSLATTVVAALGAGAAAARSLGLRVRALSGSALAEAGLVAAAGLLALVVLALLSWSSHLLARHVTVGELSAVLGACIALNIAFALAWTFVNSSSYHAFYAARLTRAYLGASNESRTKDSVVPVTEVSADDDISMETYNPAAHGGPLHFINTTIAETIEGRSQLQRMHRRGVPLCIGPCGIEVGARHHAIRKPEGNWRFERAQPPPLHQVFGSDPFVPDALTLGAWTAISGAAASTALGHRTTVARSLLAGLFNVRLGYWWDSHVPRRKRDWVVTQRALLAEWLGRFPGTARRRWYLTDGGHFENTGLYALIRRRCPVMIAVDASCDPTGSMEDIGNLVRKARIDFGAEIRFLDDSELDVRVHPELRDLFGSLDRVRAAVRNAPRGKGAYAALAEVRWSQPRAHGFIVYVKPGLRGDEPADVRHYAASNATFPHQPTSDQTFDEQQWESYRRLGDHIGERLLHTPSGAAAGQTVAGWMRAGAGPATTNGAPPEARQSAYD